MSKILSKKPKVVVFIPELFATNSTEVVISVLKDEIQDGCILKFTHDAYLAAFGQGENISSKAELFKKFMNLIGEYDYDVKEVFPPPHQVHFFTPPTWQPTPEEASRVFYGEKPEIPYGTSPVADSWEDYIKNITLAYGIPEKYFGIDYAKSGGDYWAASIHSDKFTLMMTNKGDGYISIQYGHLQTINISNADIPELIRMLQALQSVRPE